MIALRQNIIWIACLATVLLCPRAARAQEPLERAKALYASAQFADALAVLTRIQPATRAETVAAAKTRALCLIALGRAPEAEAAFETVVEADPSVRLTEAEVSPRVRALFAEVRQRVLPSLVKERFRAAKALFTEGNREKATAAFEELRPLLDDSDLAKTNVAGVSDLRVLVDGFLALTSAADDAPASVAAPDAAPDVAPNAAPDAARNAAPTAAPDGPPDASPDAAPDAAADAAPDAAPDAARNAAPPEVTMAAPAPATDGDGPGNPGEETDGDGARPAGATPKEAATSAAASAPPPASRAATPPTIVPPVVINQKVPPPRGLTLHREPATLALEVLINEQGRVERAAVTQPLHPIYDALVLGAAENWQYKPATRDGQPVKFLKTIEITVRP
jgi:TonB family protein